MSDQTVKETTNPDGTPGPIVGLNDNDPAFQKLISDYADACHESPTRYAVPQGGALYLFSNGVVLGSGNAARLVYNPRTLATWAMDGEASAADPTANQAAAATADLKDIEDTRNALRGARRRRGSVIG